MGALLELQRLTIELPTARGAVRPVNDVSLQIGEGEALGLVGESGSGKTMLALTLMGLLPPGARPTGQALYHPKNLEAVRSSAPEPRLRMRAIPPSVSPASDHRFTPLNLAALPESHWRQVRGREIAMVFQEPMTALNPVLRAGAQVEEAVRAHEPKLDSGEAHRRALEAMKLAAVPEPQVRAKQFPHQLSGGLRQRVLIAMAIAGGPRFLIADEPTTALDVTVQKEILALLDRLRRELGLGLLFITHDFGVVAQVAERVAVMYAGRIVEEGPTCEVLARPRHPYTEGLLAASPRLQRDALRPIAGTVPPLTALPPGCAFEPRCPKRVPQCRAGLPDLRPASPGHTARCILV
jgi:oligopeptide/dipeptide ABC transporter ATP-binding protein